MCDDLGICNNKITTYKLSVSFGSGFLVDSSLDGILEALKSELENYEPMPFDETLPEFTISIEQKYTQKELDEMPEFDGF